MDRQQWVKELKHRVNEANGEYYDVIELDFDEVDEIIEIIEKTYKPDCEHAEHDGTGCLGYGISSQDDEPIEACKNCNKYTGNVVT